MAVLIGDEDFNVGPTDSLYILNETLTEPRVCTLPSGSVFSLERFTVLDSVGAVDAENTLTFTPQEGETINGEDTLVIGEAWSTTEFIKLAPNAWQAVALPIAVSPEE
jgi:hypothetical protein